MKKIPEILIFLSLGFILVSSQHPPKFKTLLDEVRWYSKINEKFDIMTDDPILEYWNNATIEIIRPVKETEGSRILAMTHLAIHRTLIMCLEMFKNDNLSPQQTIDIIKTIITHAAFTILVSVQPNKREFLQERVRTAQFPLLISLEIQKDVIQASIKEAYGILESRLQDGTSGFVQYRVLEEPQYWKPTENNNSNPINTQFEFVLPFLLPLKQFLPPKPYSLNSAEFKKDCDEIKVAGNMATSNSSVKDFALFWSNKMSGMPIYWNQNVAQQLFQMGFGNNIIKKSYAYMLYNLGITDAFILCFMSKYQNNFVRPYTAIRNGLGGCAPAIPDWLPNLTPTPDHPEYLSGHGCYGTAAGQLLIHLLGTDNVNLELISEDAPGLVKRYSTITDAYMDNSISRIYGGLHWRTTIKRTKSSITKYTKKLFKELKKKK